MDTADWVPQGQTLKGSVHKPGNVLTELLKRDPKESEWGIKHLLNGPRSVIAKMQPLEQHHENILIGLGRSHSQRKGCGARKISGHSVFQSLRQGG